MILTPHQLELQEAILKRLYPNLSFEKALNKERITKTVTRLYGKEYVSTKLNENGLPPTLPRILTALGDDYYYNMYELKRRVPLFGIDTDIPRILLNEDMTDKNLWEQEQETQDILYSIFCK